MESDLVEMRPDAWALFHLWRADLARRRGADNSTTREYRRRVFDAGADLTGRTGQHPCDWTGRQIRSYLEALYTSSARQTRKALTDFIDWCIQQGYRDENPLAEVRMRSGRRRRIPVSLTDDEVTQLLVSAAWGPRWRERWMGGRRRLALLMAGHYYTGVRPGELMRLTTAHVHLRQANPLIEVVETKTDEDRIVPLNPRAADVFAELCAGRVGRISNMGVKTYHDQVAAAAARAGLPPHKRKPYMLRHTFANHLMERGVPQPVVSRLLGHKDPRSTEIYTMAHDSQMRSAVDVL